jgi:uncharacterized protein (TIGR03067 family)
MKRILVLIAFAAMTPAVLADDRAAKDLKKYQGNWSAVAVRIGSDKQLTDDELKKTRLVVTGNKFTLTFNDQTITGTFTLDPSQKPNQIDVVLDGSDKAKLIGVYEIQGNERRTCFAGSDRARPKGVADMGEGILSFHWKRQP